MQTNKQNTARENNNYYMSHKTKQCMYSLSLPDTTCFQILLEQQSNAEANVPISLAIGGGLRPLKLGGLHPRKTHYGDEY